MSLPALTPPEPRSAAMKAVLRRCVCFAISCYPILLLGESGTGKSWLARQIHGMSHVRNGPWVETHAPRLEELATSLLEGHARGAFTGAVQTHAGLIEDAAGGTLFVDEIGTASSRLQELLVTLVEATAFRPLGARRDVPATARFIFATNEPLARRISEETFREDFYQRISAYKVTLPPLRERREDIPALAEYFLEKESRIHERPTPALSSGAMERLVHAEWRGNLRELRMTLVRSLLLSDGRHSLEPDDLDFDPLPPRPAVTPRTPLTFANVRRALAQSGGNRRAAARSLGCSERQLYRIISSMSDETEPDEPIQESA